MTADEIRSVLATAADPERAQAMSTYMRNQFPFLGVPSPRRRELTRPILRGLRRVPEVELGPLLEDLFAIAERELAYVGCELARQEARHCSPAFLDVLERLLRARPWWDTVDALAHAVGALVRTHPQLLARLDVWNAGDDVWLIRTSIIHQLGFRERTDTEVLFRYCRARTDHPDFFVRKAIGWALRDYAKTDRPAVERFVAATPALSPLSRREALLRRGAVGS